jgi:hypothetical protein
MAEERRTYVVGVYMNGRPPHGESEIIRVGSIVGIRLTVIHLMALWLRASRGGGVSSSA